MRRSNLVKKIFWTGSKIESWPSDLQSLTHYQNLEEEGFGMLANKEDSNKIDESASIVCPDGTILTPKQISDYWTKRAGYNSSNLDDIRMYKAKIYYMGFKGEEINL